MNEENDWDPNVEGDAVEDPADCLSREEVVQKLDDMKMGETLVRCSFRCIIGVEC